MGMPTDRKKCANREIHLNSAGKLLYPTVWFSWYAVILRLSLIKQCVTLVEITLTMLITVKFYHLAFWKGYSLNFSEG